MKNIYSSKKSCIQKAFFFLFVLGLILLNSCVTTRKTTYLQDYKKSDIPTQSVTPENYMIQPNDNLYIRVATPDPTMSAIFNAIPQTTTMLAGEEASYLVSYPVQLDGTVELPYIGFVTVAGKTLSEAKDVIEKVLFDYVRDASITVKLVNNYVSILGEVNAPGMYSIYKDRLNIFQALSLAGDMAVYGDRYKLQIIRQTSNGSVIKEFDMTDRNIVDSEFYYIMPNDVIYVKPMKGKFFGFDQFPYALIVTTITTAILIDSYLSE